MFTLAVNFHFCVQLLHLHYFISPKLVHYTLHNYSSSDGKVYSLLLTLLTSTSRHSKALHKDTLPIPIIERDCPKEDYVHDLTQISLPGLINFVPVSIFILFPSSLSRCLYCVSISLCESCIRSIFIFIRLAAWCSMCPHLLSSDLHINVRSQVS
uniref:Uncharacterized protein n=1 Tax=Cacopsylla melanoneura TaxID=428564 RepID=A0A8D8RTQ5_9HEMI